MLFYDPLTLRPQARNVRVIEPAPVNNEGPKAVVLPPSRLEELKKIKADAMKKAQEKGATGENFSTTFGVFLVRNICVLSSVAAGLSENICIFARS